jgi:hypothetical protein
VVEWDAEGVCSTSNDGSCEGDFLSRMCLMHTQYQISIDIHRSLAKLSGLRFLSVLSQNTFSRE